MSAGRGHPVIRIAAVSGDNLVVVSLGSEAPQELGGTVEPNPTAREDLPSVFHPPEARGNRIYAVGLPFLPDRVHKGDCDQDRPN